MMKADEVLVKIVAMTLAMFAISVAAYATEPATIQAASQSSQSVLAAMSLGKIFTYFFVMLGPLKILGPFVKLTHGMDNSGSQGLAIKGFLIACAAGLVAATMGQNLLEKWGVSQPALLIAAGLVLLLVALKNVLTQYEPRHTPPADDPQPPTTASALLAISPLAFPTIITPYGIAALVLLLAAAPSRSSEILGVFLAVMVINLVVMFFARPILKYGAGVIQILGSVLGVLQVALAIQMLLLACRMLDIIPPIAV